MGVPVHSNSHQGFASQPEATWQMEKLMLREGNDLPKVTHPELEANLELGYVSSHWLLFSLQSGCPHLGCFRCREPLHHCQAGRKAAGRGAPAPFLSGCSSGLENAVLLATAYGYAELYSLQLARGLCAISHLLHLATSGRENYYPHFTTEKTEA